MQSVFFSQTTGTAHRLLALTEEGLEACLRIVKAKRYDKSLRLFSMCRAVKRKLGGGLEPTSMAKPLEGFKCGSTGPYQSYLTGAGSGSRFPRLMSILRFLSQGKDGVLDPWEGGCQEGGCSTERGEA